MNIITQFKRWRNRRLFLRIYFCYMKRMRGMDLDTVLMYAKRDYDEIVKKDFSCSQEQMDK